MKGCRRKVEEVKMTSLDSSGMKGCRRKVEEVKMTSLDSSGMKGCRRKFVEMKMSSLDIGCKEGYQRKVEVMRVSSFYIGYRRISTLLHKPTHFILNPSLELHIKGLASFTNDPSTTTEENSLKPKLYDISFLWKQLKVFEFR